jgi:hypothetical protein
LWEVREFQLLRSRGHIPFVTWWKSEWPENKLLGRLTTSLGKFNFCKNRVIVNNEILAVFIFVSNWNICTVRPFKFSYCTFVIVFILW